MKKLHCPKCNFGIWDFSKGHKLNKCHDCGLAFDSIEDETETETYCDSGCTSEAEHYAHMQYINQ